MKLCAFTCLILRAQNLILGSRNQIQIFQWKITCRSKTKITRGGCQIKPRLENNLGRQTANKETRKTGILKTFTTNYRTLYKL